MSKDSAASNTVITISVVLLRIIIGGIFVFSGFAKGIDLWGVIYKLDDYFGAFGWDWALPFSGFCAVVLCFVEFLLGVLLAIGSFRRCSVWLLLCVMAFMLPLSFYIYLNDPVSDCGCFGDAIVISNLSTFWKNILITGGLCWLLKYNKSVRSFYGPAVQWLTVLLPSLYLITIMVLGYYWQPILDFRPYKVGTYISGEDSGNDADYLFLYEKGGEEKYFSLDNLPDSSWTFINRVEKENDNAPDGGKVVNPIAIYDGDTDVTSDVLVNEGGEVLLLIPDISSINVALTFKINELYETLSDSGISMICLTGGSGRDIEDWKDISMADYPIYKMDESQLKTIARGNPALVIIDDGKIVWKSTMQSLDDDDLANLISDYGELESFDMQVLLGLTLLLAVAMSILLLVNRSPMLIKLTMRLGKNQNK